MNMTELLRKRLLFSIADAQPRLGILGCLISHINLRATMMITMFMPSVNAIGHEAGEGVQYYQLDTPFHYQLPDMLDILLNSD